MHPLARALLVVAAAELAAGLLLLAWLAEAYGWTIAVAGGLGFALAWPAVPILISYAIAARHASPVPAVCRAGVFTRVACVFAEIAVALLLYSVLIPLQGLRRARVPPGGAAPRPPVVLVHGYLLTAASWWVLQRWLAARGHPVYTVDLEMFCDIDRYAPVLHERIEGVCAATGAQRVLLVGHSMGGLAARAYLRRYGVQRVARVVTLGSPHHGSLLARVAPGENGRAMRPRSAWLQRLAQDERKGWAVPVVSIYSCHDNLVVPQASSRLEGAVNVPIAAVGHLTLAFSRRVRAALAAALDGESS